MLSRIHLLIKILRQKQHSLILLTIIVSLILKIISFNESLLFFSKLKLMEFGALGQPKVSVRLHVVQLDSNNSPELVLVHNLVVNSVLVLV